MTQAKESKGFIKYWEFAVGIGTAVACIIMTSFSTFSTKEAHARDIDSVKEIIKLQAEFDRSRHDEEMDHFRSIEQTLKEMKH